MSQSAPELLAAIAAFKKEHENDRSQLECCEQLSKVETSLGKGDTKPDQPEDQSTPDIGDIKDLRAAAARRAAAYTADLPERNPEIEDAKPHAPGEKSLQDETKLLKHEVTAQAVGRSNSSNDHDADDKAPSWGSKSGSEDFKKKAKNWLTQREGSGTQTGGSM